jgi:hypothetical protein
MNDLIKAVPDVALQAQAAINWLARIEDGAKKMVEENFEEAVKLLSAVDLMEMAASRLRIDEVVRKALCTKVTLQRELGLALPGKLQYGRPSKLNVDGNDTFSLEKLNISRDQSSKWQQIATLPEYAFKHALEINLPTTAYLLRECGRFSKIKSVVEYADIKNKPAVLKKYVEGGYTPSQVKVELDPAPKGRQDITDMFEGEDAPEIVDASEISIKSDMRVFAENAHALEKVYEELERAFRRVRGVVDAESFELGVNSLNIMRETVKKLMELFRDVKGKMRV